MFKYFLQYFTGIIVILFITGCDIQGAIVIKNKTNGKAIYRYVLATRRDSIVNINIPPTQDQNAAIILFGFGNFWKDRRIQEYARQIGYIEIVSPGDSIRITGQSQLYQFLKERRCGILKNKVSINIKK